jgi:hypothetical protein
MNMCALSGEFWIKVVEKLPNSQKSILLSNVHLVFHLSISNINVVTGSGGISLVLREIRFV